MLGQAAMQVIYTKEGNNRKVAKIKHFPIHTLRPEKMDEDGVINAYYYHPDWANKKRSDRESLALEQAQKLLRFSALSLTSLAILIFHL